MANESIQQTVTSRLPAQPGRNGPCASVISWSVGALPCVGIVWACRMGMGRCGSYSTEPGLPRPRRTAAT